MRITTRILFAGVCLVVLAAVARADFVTDSFGSSGCSKAGTMSVESVDDLGRVLKFDLSGIAKAAAVHRAVLKITVDRRGYGRPVLLYPVVADKAGKPIRADKPLELRPPFYWDFDATELARKWVADPKSNLGLVVTSAPGWQTAATALHVSYDGTAKAPAAVSGIRAAHHGGQVFVRFKEVEDVIGAEQVKFADFEAKVLATRKAGKVSYRVYRHTQPITAKTIGQAELVREVEAIMPAYNIDAVPATEFPGGNSRPSRLIGGNRVQDYIVQRFRIPMKDQLTSGENLCVMTSRQDGSFYYAVTPVVNGCEAVKELTAANSLAEPVAEKVEPVAPLLQTTSARPIRQTRSEEVYETYVCFYEPPYWPTPLRVYMCSAYDKQLGEKQSVPLEICTGTYGGQSPYNLGRRHVPGAYYVSPPVTGPMWQGMHECIGTLKTYGDGMVRNYTHRQIFALIEWAKKKWPNIDPDRVVMNGQFAIWGLRHADKFAMVVADPYANFAAGIEMQKHGPSWGPYPQAAKNEDGLVDQWEYLNVAKWIRDNPTTRIPFYVGKPSGASHVGDMGFMPAPELYRALLDTRRAFAAHYGPSQGFGGPPAAICALPIRRGQAAPAFSNCSIDDMVGEGDQWGGAAGGTIGSGDPWGRFNADLRWGFDDLTDEPARFEVTVWLDESARKDECTVDVTPRLCRKFKAAPGQAFKYTVVELAPAKAGEPATEAKPIDSGSVKADKHGLVTLEKLQVNKARRRIAISR